MENILDSNFEKLKQSMLGKKLKAETNVKSTYKNTATNNDTNIDANTNGNTYTNINNDKNVNAYTNVDVNVDTIENTNVDKTDDSNVNNNVNIAVHNHVNKFVIKTNKNEDTLIRYTLYLKPDTIDKIGYYSELLKLGKSELVRKILEDTLANLEIID